MKSVILSIIIIVMTSSIAYDRVSSAVFRWKALEVNKKETRESRPIFEGNTTYLQYFECHATTLFPGKMPHSKHTHEADDELVLVRQGKIRITSPSGSKEIGPGGIAYLLIGEEHGLENVGQDTAIYYIMKFRSQSKMDKDRGVKAGGSMVIDRSTLEFKKHSKGGRWNYFDRPTAACAEF